MTSYVTVDEAVISDLMARAGLDATYQHISQLCRKQDLLRASQIAAEEQFLCRLGQRYDAREITEVELAFLYGAYAEFAVPGFQKRWRANISEPPGRMQYILRDLETAERHTPSGPNGTWRGSWPLEDDDRVPMYDTCVVYVLYDAANEPCYVGSTHNLKGRLKVHQKDQKPFVRWTAFACADREAAYLLEEKLLAERKPYLNKRRVRLCRSIPRGQGAALQQTTYGHQGREGGGGVPRTEARIFTSIWKDGDFLALPPSAQRLYMFLLSQPELTYCGTMPLRPARWVPKAAGLTLADIERDLKDLEGSAYPPDNPARPAPGPEPLRSPFVIADSETGELLVRSLLRRDNAWKQPNLLKQAMDASEEIESPRILLALLAEVRRLPVDDSPSTQVRDLIAQWINDLEQGVRHPSAYPPGYPPPIPAVNPEDDPSADGTGNPEDDPSGNGRARAGSSNPPSSIPPTDMPARDRKLGTRLPDDFWPTPEMFEWFRKNCPHVNGKTEHAQFCDYWHAKAGKDGRKVDWVATWRNWMRTAEARSKPRTRPGQPATPVTPGEEWKFNRS